MLTESLVVLPIVILLVAAYLAPIWQRFWPRALFPASVAAAGISFGLCAYLLFLVHDGSSYVYRLGGWESPWGIELVADPLSSYMGTILLGISLLILLFSKEQLQHSIDPRAIGWFFAAALTSMAATVGITATQDLFNLFVFIEILAISSCALVSIQRGAGATEAAFKYLLLTAMGSSMMLLGIAYLYMLTGNLSIMAVQSILAEVYTEPNRLLLLALALFTVGLLIKSAVFPLHLWLPDAHSKAPAASSALLSAVLIKPYIGVFFRLYSTVFALESGYADAVFSLLRPAAALGIVVISIVTLRQTNLKRIMAYSTVVNMGYIVLGLSLSTIGVLGALVHILMHALAKAALFLMAGRLGSTQAIATRGFVRRDPSGGGLFVIACLSMIGMPLLSGFISKWRLFVAAAEFFTPYTIAMVFGAVASVIYYGRLAMWAVEEHGQPAPTAYSPPMLESVVIGVFLVIIIGLGLYPTPLLDFLTESGLSQILK